MIMKKLYIFLYAFFCYTATFAQHSYSDGSNPLYWAIVGGISSALIYLLYIGFVYGISFIRRIFKNKQCDSELDCQDNNFEQDSMEQNIISNDNSKISEQRKNGMDNTDYSDNCKEHTTSHAKMARKSYIAIGIYIMLFLISSFAIEQYVSNKQKQLFSDIVKQVDAMGERVEAIGGVNIEDVDYTEVPIPTFPNDENTLTEEHWMNMFNGVEHLYLITKGGWNIIGKTSWWAVPYDKDLYKKGVLEYNYSTYLIGVPKATKFDAKIAKKVIKKALEVTKASNDVLSADYHRILSLSESNEYYVTRGQHNEYGMDNQVMPFFCQRTGCDPIYVNGKFTGRYWFDMQEIGPYRLFFGYMNTGLWRFVEKEGFNASLKDRVIYYGLVFIILTTFLMLFILRDRNKRNNKTVHIQNTDEQMYCMYCGKVIDADSDYCRHCGKKL